VGKYIRHSLWIPQTLEPTCLKFGNL
jgi:hypothetical protein